MPISSELGYSIHSICMRSVQPLITLHIVLPVLVCRLRCFEYVTGVNLRNRRQSSQLYLYSERSNTAAAIQRVEEASSSS